MTRKTDGDEVQETLTLKTDFIYYVMNSTCIQLRVKSFNIYVYRREKYIKSPEEI
jgi:hypothetical protein